MIRSPAFRLRLRSPITISPAISTHLYSTWRLPASYAGTRTAGGESDGGSDVYRDARKYARPATVAWTERLHNSASFIGTVEYPPKKIATRGDQFGVFTVLRVKSSPDSHTYFRILLEMWDDMAQRASLYLKPEDYIYVSGQLKAYSKAALNGVERIIYKVRARELNYVKRSEPEVNPRKFVNLESEINPGKSQLPSQKYKSRLHLWQVFFADPNEWYDQRKTKKTPRQPDFKHKSTGEALWLSMNDPPWVRKQLELLDSQQSWRPKNDATSKFLFSRWLPDS